MVVIETALIGSTLYLGYVTQFPYHVRRRHLQHIHKCWVLVRVKCGHHWRWLCWQITAVMPGRVRNTDYDEE